MKSMLLILLTVILIFSISICIQDETTLHKECIEKGFVLKNKKVLNYRTGKYVMKNICMKD